MLAPSIHTLPRSARLNLALSTVMIVATLPVTAALAQVADGEPTGNESGVGEMGADDTVGSAHGPETTGTGPNAGSVELTDQQALTEEQLGVEVARDSTDPYEDPTEGYYFVGLAAFAWFVPPFILELFTDEAPSAVNPFLGAEFTYRKDGFDIIGSVFWAGGSVEGPFRASGDPVTDTEIIDSNLSALMVSARFMWSTQFNDIFSLQYGVGVGLGFVFGDLIRTEAHRDSDNGEFRACNGVGDPAGPFCDGPSVADGERGGHYNVKARSWADGGSVPIVVPWLYLPTIALRIKPIKQLMIRIEGGLGLGFFLGGSVNYGF